MDLKLHSKNAFDHLYCRQSLKQLFNIVNTFLDFPYLEKSIEIGPSLHARIVQKSYRVQSCLNQKIPSVCEHNLVQVNYLAISIYTCAYNMYIDNIIFTTYHLSESEYQLSCLLRILCIS